MTGKWLAALPLALVVSGPLLAEEQKPRDGRYTDSQPENRANQKVGGEALAAGRSQGPVAKSEEQNPRNGDSPNERRNSDPAWVAADAAQRANSISILGLLVGIGTVLAAGAAAIFTNRTARAAIASRDAFVAAEDASLVVEFPSGGVLEHAIEGVRQPDSYCFDFLITNIGRSTARVHGWQINGGKFERREHTLEANASWSLEDEIIVVPTDGYFDVSIHYFSPLGEERALDVTAKVRGKRLDNGATHFSARVKKRLLRRPNDQGA